MNREARQGVRFEFEQRLDLKKQDLSLTEVEFGSKVRSKFGSKDVSFGVVFYLCLIFCDNDEEILDYWVFGFQFSIRH